MREKSVGSSFAAKEESFLVKSPIECVVEAPTLELRGFWNGVAVVRDLIEDGGSGLDIAGAFYVNLVITKVVVDSAVGVCSYLFLEHRCFSKIE